MNNITDILNSIEINDNWSEENVNEVIKQISKNNKFTIDWDKEAGEEWVSILEEDEKIAMINIKIPLAFCLVKYSILSGMGLVVIKVNNFDDEKLIFDKSLLKNYNEKFNWHIDEETINKGKMSINDFWFCTI